MRTGFGIGAFAIGALLVAGISYWAVRPNPQSSLPQSPPTPTHLTEAPSGPIQDPNASAKLPSVEQPSPDAGSPASQPTAPISGLAPTATAPGSTTSADQSAQPPAPPPNTAQGRPGQTSPQQPPAAALATSMPSEDKMSVSDRRQVQEALHRLGYYEGPLDGIFGPLTRAAIRRFQESLGDQSTGHLTVAEATRLVSRS